MSLKSLINDPQFASLSPDDQRNAVFSIEPDAAKLPSQEYDTFVNSLRQQPQSSANSIANLGSKYAIKGITLPLNNPIANKLEDAGNYVNKNVQGVAGRVAEAGSPLAATGISMLGDIGKLTPTNAALSVGGELMAGANALPLPSAGLPGAVAGKTLGEAFQPVANKVDELLKIPTIKSELANGINNVMSALQNKFGIKLSPEEAGQAIKQSFEAGYAPKEAAANTAIESGNLANKQAYEQELAKQKQAFISGQESKKAGMYKASQGVSKRFGDEPLTLSESGQQVGDEVKALLNKKRGTSNALYEKLGSQMGESLASNKSDSAEFIDKVFSDQGINYTQSKSNIEKMFRELGAQDLVDKYSPQDLLQMQDKLTEARSGQFSAELDSTKKAAYSKMVQVMNDINNPNLTAKQLSRVRTEVGHYAYSSMDDPIKAVYRGLYGALTNDIDRTAAEGGFSTISKGARTFYKGFKDLGESDIAKAVNTKDPSQLIDAVAKANGPEKVDRLMANLSDEGRNTFRNGLINKINENATQDTIKGPLTNPKDIVRGINKYTDETLKSIFGEKYPTVDAYRKYAESLSHSETFKPSIAKPAPVSASNSAEASTADLIRKTKTDLAIGRITKDKSLVTLNSMLSNMDEQGIKTLKRALLDNIVSESKNPVGNLDMRLLSKNMSEFPTEYVNALYGKDSGIWKSLQKVAFYQSQLKTNVAEDIGRLITYFHSPSAVKGFWSKFRTPSYVREATGEMANQFVKPVTSGAVRAIEGPARIGLTGYLNRDNQ